MFLIIDATMSPVTRISVPRGKVPTEGEAQFGEDAVRGISLREAEPRDTEGASNETTESTRAFIRSLSAPQSY